MMVGKKKTFVYILLVIWSIINLFPIYFMFTFSLKGNDEIFGENIIGLPKHWLWSNYSSALGTGNSLLLLKLPTALAELTVWYSTRKPPDGQSDGI